MPVWGPSNLTGGSEPKWGRAGSGRKVPRVKKNVKENLADSDVAADVGRVAAINLMLQQTHDKLTQTLQHMYVCVNLPCANVRFEGQVI